MMLTWNSGLMCSTKH